MDMIIGRGFTLLEFIITVAVSGVLLSISLPNIQRFYHDYQVVQLSVKLKSFFVQARSEALSRREDLWVYFYAESGTSLNGWQLVLQSRRDENAEDNELITMIEGDGMMLSPSWSSLKLDGRTGRILENGNLLFSARPASSISLQLITHHVTGRVRICANGRPFHGYPKC